MPTSELLTVPYTYERPLPDFQNGDDIRFPDSLVAVLLDRFTKPGDKVFDPFSGLGTTFFVCEQKARIPYGIEADRQRYDWVKSRVNSKDNLLFGDSGDIGSFNLPEMDFSITSPPYMPHWHEWNPLYNGDPRYDGYDIYLERLQSIYAGVCRVLRKDACVIVQADNLTHERFSTLVWDLGKALSEVMTLEGEIIVNWSENAENEYQFTQCLVFKNNVIP
ncbi:DNA methyltransferase [Labrenzia sp. OB1]|uniref:DNA methyltransferase n=1 Tax=Labrenzia sp. OB1 TaxID=1561204 RepID=UPI0007B228D0|nr:DNA methyltransferase [Labrenzia sp. OB1]KZM49195.1 DNA methylase [Labrenzia sp. OB1]